MVSEFCFGRHEDSYRLIKLIDNVVILYTVVMLELLTMVGSASYSFPPFVNDHFDFYRAKFSSIELCEKSS